MNMKYKKNITITVVCLSLLIAACASEQKLHESQFLQWHYAGTVPLDTELRGDSPRLEVTMSLLQMRYPPEQAKFLNNVLYFSDDFNEYKDRVIRRQRENYRVMFPALENTGGEDSASFDWRYTENIIAGNTENMGIVVERVVDTYTGGAHGLVTKRYYVIDLDSHRLINIDDIFQDFQGEKTRAIVYSELRNYSGLAEDQPLSEGIYLSDEPELSSNFFVSQEGVGLRWDPYEITPYYAGGIDIIIPWKKIRPLLLHSGMELLTKFNIYLFI